MLWAFLAFLVIVYVAGLIRDHRNRPAPCRHGMRGSCAACDEDARLSSARARAEARARHDHEVMEIYDQIDEASKTEIIEFIMERDRYRARQGIINSHENDPTYLEEQVIRVYTQRQMKKDVNTQ